ncbi:hypothetical protein HSBAA_33350 [Vreelandella sulfidaeris]|uniref:Cyclic nucleotide-binding domain-containing protein n=1 Tax=Vreelandella sulfidaeris TaxID=115553 RepID=A0A455UC55_9GAMM|nr:hypothetical protein HSBAA_33350 [Halomonas sulfidaeris]
MFSKLSYYMTLSQDEKQLLEAAGNRSILVEKGDIIINEGERPEHVYPHRKGVGVSL